METKTPTMANTVKSAARAQKQEAREQKKEARAQKVAESGRPERATRLCSFSTVEVRKGAAGYQVFVKAGERRYKLLFSTEEAATILKDIESAVQVIRGQL